MPDFVGGTLLHRASNAEFVKYLIQKGLEVNTTNAFGETPLHRVCLFPELEIVEVLVEAGADGFARDLQDCAPLDNACDVGNVEVYFKLKGSSTERHKSCVAMFEAGGTKEEKRDLIRHSMILRLFDTRNIAVRKSNVSRIAQEMSPVIDAWQFAGCELCFVLRQSTAEHTIDTCPCLGSYGETKEMLTLLGGVSVLRSVGRDGHCNPMMKRSISALCAYKNGPLMRILKQYAWDDHGIRLTGREQMKQLFQTKTTHVAVLAKVFDLLAFSLHADDSYEAEKT